MWKNKVKGYELAKATGLSPATISKLVRGDNTNIKLETIYKICKFFNCKIEDMIEFK